ncbi:MAG: hypothetical protein R3D45_05230 [Rhizobiaceae bacterium]
MQERPEPGRPAVSAIEIDEAGSRRDMTTFIRLPRLIYKGMTGFEAPLDHERRQLIAPPAAPFLKAGEVAWWIARREGEPVGRISAQMPFKPARDADTGATIGYFGCLDAIDDGAVVSALLGRAAGWLAERGCSIVQGPFALSINGETGLLVEGQARGGMIMLPWHPDYLAGHVEQAGFRQVKDVVSYTYRRATKAPFVDWLMERPLEEAFENMVVRPLDMKRLGDDLEIIREIYNDAWRDNWGFLPVSRDEARALEKATRDLLVADCGVIVEHDGKPVAAALLLPNLFEIIGEFDGRLLPFNWIKLLARMARKPYRSARILLFGVRPSESKKPHGPLLPAMILRAFLQRAPRYRLEEFDMGWVLDHRSEIRNMLDRTGATLTRRHRIYQRTL